MNDSTAPLDETIFANHPLVKFWETGDSAWKRIESTRKEGEQTPIALPGVVSLPFAYAHKNKIKLRAVIAKEFEMNPDTLSKAWKVAREYSRSQIIAMCASVQKHESAFGPTHLTRLLAIQNRRVRDKLTKEAISDRWGVTTLERRIQAIKGKRRPNVGHKPKIPKTQADVLASLEALCDKLIRWLEAANSQIPTQLGVATKSTKRSLITLKTKAADELMKQSRKS